MVSISCRLRWFLRGLISGPLLATILLAILVGLGLPQIGNWLDQPAELGHADAIVVLSGGGPGRMFHGIALYQQGWAPELWYTGDRPIPAMTSFTDAQLARDFALAQGVPAEAIHLLPTTSTWEDGQEIASLAHQEDIHNIIVVTDWYHSRRALCVIKKGLADADVQVYFSSPPALTYGPDNWWQHEDGLVAVTNELIKFGFYWWRYGLIPWQC